MTDEPKLKIDEILVEVLKEAFGVQREMRGLVRDHLREKGGKVWINGVEVTAADVEEH